MQFKVDELKYSLCLFLLLDIGLHQPQLHTRHMLSFHIYIRMLLSYLSLDAYVLNLIPAVMITTGIGSPQPIAT